MLAGLAGLALAASFAGALHPAGDSLAVLRLPLAGIFALLVIWAPWRRALRWPLALAALVAMGQIVGAKFVAHSPGPVVVYQKNLLFRNTRIDDLARDIESRSPDLVMLQEVSRHNRAILDRLRGSYPHQTFCPFTSWSGMAVLSRHPANDAHCSRGLGLAALRVDLSQGPVWAASLHMHWPWPHGQADQRDALLPILSGLEAPVILGGDFNMVPWSFTFRALAGATGTERAGPLAATLIKRRVPLPIDQVLAPGGGSAEILPRLGSDHHGVLARVRLAAPPAP